MRTGCTKDIALQEIVHFEHISSTFLISIVPENEMLTAHTIAIKKKNCEKSFFVVLRLCIQ